MSYVIFDSIADYLGTCQDNQARVAALDKIIDQMLVTATAAAESGHLDEYWYDDGHIKIRMKYRNAKEVFDGIRSLEQIKQIYLNRITGRVSTLMDAKNFRFRNLPFFRF
jgi:hypothetical protein